MLAAVLSSGAHGGGGGGHGANGSVNAVELCGASFCTSNHHGIDNLERPPNEEIYEISGIYLACIVVAVIIVALFVDPLSR